MHGLVSLQFLASFNTYLGGSIDISKDAMTEFFHNLFMQALSTSYHKVILRLETIFPLVRNIACFLQNRVDESIDAKRQKSEELARLINDYEEAAEKNG